ncbi:MAG TPA: lysylphosphatidylglycerol synthase transmembrane domain-containing protein [Gemmatimonadales bacterium]|nr:lysylphosphatidylglycerol synthase transmembrane domain-containing protein [Gemmatimonadales bacterium]
MNHRTSSRSRLWLVRLARLAVTAALFALVLRRIEVQQLLQIASEIRPRYVVVLLVCSLGERIFGAWRWYLLLRDHHSAISFGPVLRLTFVSALVGVLLPGAVGTYAVRAYGIARMTSDLGISVASLLADRLLVGLAMLLILCVGLITTGDIFPPDVVRWTAFAAAGTTAVILITVHPAVGALLDRLLKHRWLQPLRRVAVAAYAFVAEFRRQPLRAAAFLIAALVLQLIRVAVVTAGLWAVGAHVSPVVVLVLMPVTVFALLIPISFAGLGVREVTFVYLLGEIGVPAEPAFAAALLIYASALLSTLPGAVFLVRGRLGAPKAGKPAAPQHNHT